MKDLSKRDAIIAKEIFGKLTVIGTDSKGRIKCRCDCGKTPTYTISNIDSGIQCCGCTFGGFGKKNALLTGQFGKLKVTSINKGKTDNTVNCECDCGNLEKVSARRLFLKEITSCKGCKDTRTEAMKSVETAVVASLRKDMLIAESMDNSKTTRSKAFINMRCDCGNLKSFEYRGLLQLEYGSCGCYKPKILKPSPATLKVLEVGNFTNWEVIGWAEDDPRYVNCLCKCGNTGRIRSDSLLTGDATSCGCRARLLCSERFKGRRNPDAVTRHRLYPVYKGIFSRCYKETNEDFKHYGGRGIVVCSRWTSPPRDVTGFLNFLEDMEGSYEEGLEVERVNVNGNYEPENCTWVCRKSQVNNLRRNRLLSGFGIELTVAEWGHFLGFNCSMLSDRINKGKDTRTLEAILSDTFRDRKHTLLYKGKECNASEVWDKEGYTLGQRNGRLTKHGDSLTAFEAEGIVVEVIKERNKSYMSFEEALCNLREKVQNSFEKHLLLKIEKQIGGNDE